MDYQAQDKDAAFLLFDVFHADESWAQIKEFEGLTPDLARAILAESGRVASQVMAPLNEIGDNHGCQWNDGEVTTPPGFKEGFSELTQGGWLGLSGNPAFGGQGMPKVWVAW